MNACSQPECQTAAGCQCNRAWQPIYVSPRHSLPIQMPVPFTGMVTEAVMQNDGSLQIRTDRPPLPMPISEEEQHAISHAKHSVKQATPEKSEVAFDYELVQDLLNVIERFAER